MEMILVLAIIGVLVGLGIFAMKNVPDDAAFIRARADLTTLKTNLIRYKTVAGALPSQVQGTEALVKRPPGNPAPKSWYKFCDDRALLDPWGKPFQYRNPAKKSDEAYDVFSMGKDGIEGTADDVYTD
ncbi:MAG: xcpT [Verrucomicrobiaceae bacterium]|nr:xcpT [Verrucomicrobiaceae bacterium]